MLGHVKLPDENGTDEAKQAQIDAVHHRLHFVRGFFVTVSIKSLPSLFTFLAVLILLHSEYQYKLFFIIVYIQI